MHYQRRQLRFIGPALAVSEDRPVANGLIQFMMRALLVFSVASGIWLVFAAFAWSAQAADQNMVVILKDGSAAPATQAQNDGVTATQTYDNTTFSGYAGRMSSAQQQKVASDPDTLMVVPDTRYSASDIGTFHTMSASDLQADGATVQGGADADGVVHIWQIPQYVPRGVERIGTEDNATADINGHGPGVRVNVAVLDSGIERNQADLNVVQTVNCSDDPGLGDPWGHGTVVAGVIGAKDNGFGVVGVAPGARLYSVRVLDDEGYANLSNLLCGINWVTRHHNIIQVANMSLGGPGSNDNACGLRNHDALHFAICRSVAAGVTYVAAAGNYFDDANNYTPASYPEVITVSGFSDTDGLPGTAGAPCDGFADGVFAPFSNWGTAVAISAPAVCIPSTGIDNTVQRADGTSFAAPHVAGAAALYIANHPGASPWEVRWHIISTREQNPLTGDPDGIDEGLVNVADPTPPPSCSPSGHPGHRCPGSRDNHPKNGGSKHGHSRGHGGSHAHGHSGGHRR